MFAGPRARADNHAFVDQVVLEPSSIGGQRLRILMSALTLEGQVVDSGTPRVLIDKKRYEAPYTVGTYGATQSDTAIVVVVQSTVDFTEVLPIAGEALDAEVFANANDRTQVAILMYGEAVGPGKLGSLRGGRAAITKLQSDGSAGEPALLDAIERAVSLLAKATTKPEGRPLRKMIVVIGDGRDASNDRDRVIRVGNRAAKQNVRIHTMGFSPKDIRRPLLLLGELSKRSLGTFRWVRGAKADSWSAALQQLGAELTKQTVITVFVPPEDDVANKKVTVQLVGRTELAASNELRIPEASCNREVCEVGAYCASDRCVTPKVRKGRGVFGWVLVIGGIVLGGLVVLGLIGFVITKRQQLALRVGVPNAPPLVVPHVHASRPPAPAKGPPVSQPPPAGGPRLHVISGQYAGQEFPLKHGFFIGKTAGCDLLIDDGFTSGHHAQFVMDGSGSCRLFDYGSTNGTFVNGQRVQDIVLEHGATIKIGSTELRFLAQ